MNKPQASSSATSASLIKRLMATMYDLIVLCALSMAYWALATAIIYTLNPLKRSPNYLPMEEGPLSSLGWLFTIIVFYWFFWMRAGQTVGMRAWRLKVVSRDEKPLRHTQCFVRICLAPFALGLAGIGYLWCLTNKERLALHDLASGTRVIFIAKPTSPKRIKT